MDSVEAVEAFVRAAEPQGVLSGVYAFLAEQSCRMIKPNDVVVDFGCGPGSLLMAIAQQNPLAHFVGLDLSDEMLSHARRHAADAGLSNVEFRNDDMTKASSVGSDEANVVLSSMAFHHLPNTESLRQAFLQIDRVLVDGGRLFIADFGRLKHLKSIEYFVRRAIPLSETILEHDYRASLRAAFSRSEFNESLTPSLATRLGIYATAVSPILMVLMTPYPNINRQNKSSFYSDRLPKQRLADLWQLKFFLKLGGMPLR